MKLEDVPDGERIFIDANILIYHFSGISSECRAFLQRCESKSIAAFTGVHVLLEVTHRLMILEAVHKGLVSGGQSVRRLKERPTIIQSLREYNQSIQNIPRMGIQVKTVTLSAIRASATIRVQEGLLTNIATYDFDLDRVSGLQLYQPGDIP
jgi:predicted nucleic acid-binding protein